MTDQIRVVDCFMFYNELEILEYRLSLLYAYVDAFILVESTRTHKGNLKTLYYQENKERYLKYADKIIHVIVDDLYSDPKIDFDLLKGEQWINEKHQRDAITMGIDRIQEGEMGWKLKEKDILFITDVDEIIDKKYLEDIKHALHYSDSKSKGLLVIPMYFYYYNLKNIWYIQWPYARAITYSFYQNISFTNYSGMSKYRDLSEEVRKLTNYDMKNCAIFSKIAGWHFSFFGSEYFIENKLKEFGHQEYNSLEYTDPEKIKEKIKNGKDLFGRNRDDERLIQIKISENPYLPPFPPCPEGVDPLTLFPFCL